MKRLSIDHNFNGAAAASSTRKTDQFLPSMIVFDLDDCLWHPEMHELTGMPEIPIQGELDPTSVGEHGVVGLQVPRRRTTVRLYEGARLVLRELALDPRYRGIILACASTSLEPSYSQACLEGIEVLPGLFLRDMFQYNRIGRTGELTSRKTGHFGLLHQDSGVSFREMLFFDDCNWGDHCADVTNTLGVVSVQTPSGLRLSQFHDGLQKYHVQVEKRIKSLE